jgi:hypothetical protein
MFSLSIRNMLVTLRVAILLRPTVVNQINSVCQFHTSWASHKTVWSYAAMYKATTVDSLDPIKLILLARKLNVN